MENEPFLPSQARPGECHDATFSVPRSHSNPVIFSEIQDHQQQRSQLEVSVSWENKPWSLHRSRTTSAMVVMGDLEPKAPQILKPQIGTISVVKQAMLLLVLYLVLGVVICSFNRDHYCGIETHPVVDALYCCVVTTCTIGYGDIAPLNPTTKVFACVFVLVRLGFIGILLSVAVNHVLYLQENMILTGSQTGKAPRGFSAWNCIVDVETGRLRTRLKVGLAIAVVVFCICIGTLVLYYVEDLDWVDSVYSSVMSITTVGCNHRAFRTLPGRLFAAAWLLLSPAAVVMGFLYLAEARIDKRHQRIANWILHRDITVEDLLAADINNNGFISKSEYVIFKLKEMGKIREKDIIQICNQFSKLDPNNLGKITQSDLLEHRI